MQRDKHKTRVLFVYPRYDGGAREVLALFPCTKRPSRAYSGVHLVDCYAHTGQHGTACYSFLRRKRATADQYKALAAELRGLGYKLDIINEKKG
jgi:hypothetical protein